MQWVREWWPVITAFIGAVAFAAVANYRVGQVESDVKDMKQVPADVRELQGDAKRIKCEISNVKALIKNQPENLCI